jgi:hypothetical protein
LSLSFNGVGTRPGCEDSVREPGRGQVHPCFNAAPGHLVEIAELVVFGSYLDPTVDRLGDLDLTVKFRELRADLSADECMKKRLAYSRASGRQFNNFNDKLSWPEHEGGAVP